MPFWFFCQVVEDGYRFFEKRKVCQSFGLLRHCELSSVYCSAATHVILTGHKRRNVHAQSPNQPDVSIDKNLTENQWIIDNSRNFIDTEFIH